MRRRLGIVLCLPLLAGCPVAARLTTGYRPTAATLRSQPVDATLTVRRFSDARPPRLYTTQGRMMLAMIPLVPWGTMPFERVDETVRLQSERGAVPQAPDFDEYAYPASFARAAAVDLASAGLFREVVYVGTDPASSRYVLDGTLLATPFVYRKTCYFLGLPGCYIDFLGVPSIRTRANVELALTLRDTSSNAVVWQKTVSGEASKTFNDAYSSPILYGPSIFSFITPIPPADWPVDDRSVFAFHFEALRRAMATARPEMAAALTGG